MDWRFIERVTVRKTGNSFIGEARFHCHFETGEICADPAEAMDSAAKRLSVKLAPKPQPKTVDLFGDL